MFNSQKINNYRLPEQSPMQGRGTIRVDVVIERYEQGYPTEFDGDDLARETGDMRRFIQIVNEV